MAVFMGFSSLLRALHLDAQMSAVDLREAASRTGRAAPWELVMVAVMPSLQGRGVGKAMVARVLEEWRSAQAGQWEGDGEGKALRQVLQWSTQDERALRMYGNLGCTVTAQRTIRVPSPWPWWVQWVRGWMGYEQDHVRELTSWSMEYIAP